MSDHASTGLDRPYQANLYDEIKDKPLHVDVVVLQKGRTQQHVIERELMRVKKAQSLEEIKEQLLEAQEALEALNIFQAVELILAESIRVRMQCSEITCTVRNRFCLHEIDRMRL